MINGEPSVVTLELPWRNNEFSLSCIPAGEYECKRDTNRKTTGGLKIPVTYEVSKVPSRAGILFHIGNTSKDSRGCILVGSRFGELNFQPAILGSAEGFATMLKLLSGKDSFSLIIRWA